MRKSDLLQKKKFLSFCEEKKSFKIYLEMKIDGQVDRLSDKTGYSI